MAIINLTLGSIGGIGKSTISNFIACHAIRQERKIVCIDTDPATPVFSSYELFKAQHFNLIDKSTGEINIFLFNDLMRQLLALGDDDYVVIDSGASNYIALHKYLSDTNVFDILLDAGHEIRLHVILCGGAHLSTTRKTVQKLLEQFDNVEFFVWLNYNNGNVEADGIRFHKTKLYNDHQDKITSLIKLPNWRAQYDSKILDDLFKARKTFLELDYISDLLLRNPLERKWNNLYSILNDSGL